MIVGYARVSTKDQRTDGQIPALKQAKCTRIYEEKQSARTMDRPELRKCLDALRDGDTLVVWRLDRLARSLRDDMVPALASLDDLKPGGHFNNQRPFAY